MDNGTPRKLMKINNSKKIHFSHNDNFMHGKNHVMLGCKLGFDQVDSFTETPMTVDEFRQSIDENKICKTCLRELLRWKGGRMQMIEWMIDGMYGDE
tara:strand:+ start:13791 stop:14081 length:291 start_codon:yes stop_codon:yes gene_type:complete